MAKKKAAKKASGKRMGRPPLPEGAPKKEKVISTWLTEDQMRTLKEAAKSSGQKQSQFLREAAMEIAKRILDEKKSGEADPST